MRAKWARPVLDAARLREPDLHDRCRGAVAVPDKKTGKVAWTQSALDITAALQLIYGYSCSPIAFRELVIVPVGGRGRAIMAFHQPMARCVVPGNLGNVYSSPILINVSGLEHSQCCSMALWSP